MILQATIYLKDRDLHMTPWRMTTYCGDREHSELVIQLDFLCHSFCQGVTTCLCMCALCPLVATTLRILTSVFSSPPVSASQRFHCDRLAVDVDVDVFAQIFMNKVGRRRLHECTAKISQRTNRHIAMSAIIIGATRWSFCGRWIPVQLKW